MSEKLILSFIFVLLLLIFPSIYVGTVDIRSYFFPQFQSPSPSSTEDRSICATSTTEPPLKVYMYDLPRRFHVGMMSRGEEDDDDTPVTAENLPVWRKHSGLTRQHSVEYWLMASLLYGGGGEEREAVRVLDAELADVFFVPFFSSMSYNKHSHRSKALEREKDLQLQADLVEYLRKSKYWKRSEGRDHVIPITHPNAFSFLRQEVNASIFIVADFGRYSRSLSTLRKDVVAPYVHVVDSFEDDNDDLSDPFESRTTLLFFRGSTVKKDEVQVRAKLSQILTGYEDVLFERSFANKETIKESAKGMRSSKFCLHPAGDTPSSCRLFDAIVSHCVPVIVSDQIELPYEDELDYTQFSVFFSANEAFQPGFMVNQLRQFPKDRWMAMWRQLKNISHFFEFQYPPKKGDAVDMLWRQVKHKLPEVQLAIHRSRRLKIPDWW